MTKTDKKIRNRILRRAIFRLKFYKLFFPNCPYGMCIAMRKEDLDKDTFARLFPDFAPKNYFFFHGIINTEIYKSHFPYCLYWDTNDKDGLKRRITFLKAIKKNGYTD